jgi:hypothetical protein
LQITGYEPLLTPKPVDDQIWIVDGPIISFYGLPFPTRMTLIRLDDGGLFVHSPVTLTADLREAVDELGPVQHLIAPNWIHYAYLPEWQAAYPKAQTHAAPGVRERASGRGVAIRIEHLLGSKTPAAWAGQIDQLLVEGNPVHREVVFFHRRSRTLVLTDLIENFEAHKCPAWMRPLITLAGARDPDGRPPFDMRLSFRLGHRGRGRAMLREAVETMLAWDPQRVIVAHGRWYAHDGAAELRRAFRWVW